MTKVEFRAGDVTAVGLIVTNLETPSRAASLLLMGLLVAVAGLSAGLARGRRLGRGQRQRLRT